GELLEQHLGETESQIERINECFELLGKTARAKPCKGMMGLVEEGQEIMAEGEKKEDAAADLALTERRSVSSTMRSRLTRRRRTSPSNYATAPSSHCC